MKAKSVQLKQYAPWVAIVGLLGLIVAAILGIIQREFTTPVQVSLAVGILGLALAGLLNPEAVQGWLGTRQARYGGNVLVMTVAMFGIVGVLNYLAFKNPQQWDWSADQASTLAPETRDALKQLPQPVIAIGFYTNRFSAAARSNAEALLKRYQIEAQGQFDYEFHDPEQEPALAQQYNITTDGKIILTMGDQREELTFADEATITGALVRLTHPTKRVIYFLIGHGEREIDDSGNNGLTYIVDVLKKQNYEVMPLNLQVTTTVPADARALVIAGPQIPVTPEEVTLIGEYLQRPGSGLVVLLDPPLEGLQTRTKPGEVEPLADYLSARWGLILPQNVVVDINSSLPNQPFVPVSYEYGAGSITNRLQSIATLFPLARSVKMAEDAAQTFPNLRYTELVKTSQDAWGETDLANLSAAGAEEGAEDTAGPLLIGAAAEDTTAKSRVVVFGDSDFVANSLSNRGVQAQLFANSVNWATTEESLINLTTKPLTTRTLDLIDDLTLRLIFFFTVIVMPLSVLIAGGIVWFQRRRHV